MWDFWRIEVKGVCKKGVEVLEIVIWFPKFSLGGGIWNGKRGK
jgi:hypothetical protein